MYLNKDDRFWVIGKSSLWLRFRLTKYTCQRAIFYITCLSLTIIMYKVYVTHPNLNFGFFALTTGGSALFSFMFSYGLLRRYLEATDKSLYANFQKSHATKLVCLSTLEYRQTIEILGPDMESYVNEYHDVDTYVLKALQHELNSKKVGYIFIFPSMRKPVAKYKEILDEYFAITGQSAFLLTHTELTAEKKETLKKIVDVYAQYTAVKILMASENKDMSIYSHKFAS
jgi:hypothetical protein